MPSYSGIWTLQQQMQARGDNLWPSPPGAPTIGTATQASSTSVSVTFTAPSNLGIPAVITGYTVTSSPGGITGTGASSPIVVSGLTTGTAYTFTVTATNATGISPSSAASNSVTPALPAIGSAFGGGFFAGQIGVGGVATHNLVVGPVASAQDFKAWKNALTATAGADSVIDGPQNTTDMVADGNSTVYPAAHFCNDLVIGGFSDWYMPAINELEVCYYNLKPTTASNDTAWGINANAVPARASNYTSGNPAQTIAADFKNTGSEFFTNASYWSSTEVSTSNAQILYFNTGFQDGRSKTQAGYRVRAVRRVAV